MAPAPIGDEKKIVVSARGTDVKAVEGFAVGCLES
jgi:hypothetical protein